MLSTLDVAYKSISFLFAYFNTGTVSPMKHNAVMFHNIIYIQRVMRFP